MIIIGYLLTCFFATCTGQLKQQEASLNVHLHSCHAQVESGIFLTRLFL